MVRKAPPLLIVRVLPLTSVEGPASVSVVVPLPPGASSSFWSVPLIVVVTELAIVKAPFSLPLTQEKLLPVPVNVPVPFNKPVPVEPGEPTWNVVPLPRLTVPFNWILPLLSINSVPPPLMLTPEERGESGTCRSRVLLLPMVMGPESLKATLMICALGDPGDDAGTTTLPLLLNGTGFTQQVKALMADPGSNVTVPVLVITDWPKTSVLLEMVALPSTEKLLAWKA